MLFISSSFCIWLYDCWSGWKRHLCHIKVASLLCSSEHWRRQTILLSCCLQHSPMWICWTSQKLESWCEDLWGNRRGIQKQWLVGNWICQHQCQILVRKNRHLKWMNTKVLDVKWFKSIASTLNSPSFYTLSSDFKKWHLFKNRIKYKVALTTLI